MKSAIVVLSAAAGWLFAVSAHAHHSAAVLYKMDKQITINGVVTRFTLGNPHARIYLTVMGPDGKAQKWMAEGGSRTVLISKGWTGNEVHAGDKVKILGNPSRDGSHILHWERLFLPDGRQLWGEDLNPAQLRKLRERRNAERQR